MLHSPNLTAVLHSVVVGPKAAPEYSPNAAFTGGAMPEPAGTLLMISAMT